MAEQKKNWFKRHKILTGILVFIVLVIAITGLSGGNSSTQKSSNNQNQNAAAPKPQEEAAKKTYKFEDRADKQPKDVETLPNEPATVDGVQVTISGIEYKTRLSDFDVADSGNTYVVADVKLENTSNETKPYNVFDFRIQTAGGQVLDGALAVSVSPTLSSGDLVAGGKASGKIVFEVPIEEGHQYIIWKPNAFNADRAIIQAK